MAGLKNSAEYFHFAKEPSCGTRCLTVGHTNIRPRDAYPASPGSHPSRYKKVNTCRSLSEFHLVYIPSGSGWFTDDSGATATIRTGTVMLLFPNIPHAYSPFPDSGWEEFWVGCTGSYPNWLIRENAFSRTRPILTIGRDDHLLSDFKQLCRHPSDIDPESLSQQLGGVVNRLIGRLLLLQERPASRDGEWARTAVDKIKKYLDDHIFDDIEMSNLSKLAGMKYGELSAAFRKMTGLTPHKYYLERKIEIAVSLLRTGKSVKETAFALGFDSPYYFSRIFKQKKGRSPSLSKDIF